MEIDQWWPRLEPETRQWLVVDNGDVVPAAVVDRISRAGAVVTSEASWVGRADPQGGLLLSDAAVDWIEEAANGEH